MAVATELGVSDEAICDALSAFKGVGRRFTQTGEFPVPANHGGGTFTVIDDYGHHPSELEAVFAAARGGWADKRLVVAFQPHRYSRTRDQFDKFAAVLSSVDALVLSEVYPAGEEPIAGADSHALARAIRARGRSEPVVVGKAAELASGLPDVLQDGDLLLMMGAGDIGAVASHIAVEGFKAEGEASSEREVSLDSGRNVLEALQARGIDAFAVDGIPALAKELAAGGPDGRLRRAVHRLERAGLGAAHGQDPHQAGVAGAGPVRGGRDPDAVPGRLAIHVRRGGARRAGADRLLPAGAGACPACRAGVPHHLCAGHFGVTPQAGHGHQPVGHRLQGLLQLAVQLRQAGPARHGRHRRRPGDRAGVVGEPGTWPVGAPP
ncbi:hypothetical protein G6F62_012228 [Rhizopus arrhizus]|nr:hypothetical protein G6F62_012228 [Rhizopus arrhizus]